MHFDVDIHPAEIPKLFDQFVAITGVEPWARKGHEFERQLRENPLFAGYLDIHFALERAVLNARRYKQSTGRMRSIEDAETGHLYSFIAATVRVHHRLPETGKKALRDAIIGALKGDVGIAPLAFEMRTATHFITRGMDVEFHDLCGSGGFDLLVHRGSVEVEVECKSVSADLGRPVHLLRQYQLGKYIRSELEAHKELGSIQLVIATLPDRLFGQRDLMEGVAERIRRCLRTQSDVEGDAPCSASYHKFDIKDSPFDTASAARIKEQDVIDYCARKSGESVGHLVLMFRPGNYATVVAIQSRRPNEPLKGIYRILREAAKAQPTGDRPGILCVQFRDLTSDNLLELANTPRRSGEPTGLQLMTSKLFASESFRHVHTIAYVAPGNFIQRQNLSLVPYSTELLRTTSIGEDAGSYTFTNQKNAMSGDPAYDLFRTPS